MLKLIEIILENWTFVEFIKFAKCTDLRTTPFDQYFLGTKVCTTPFDQYSMGVGLFEYLKVRWTRVAKIKKCVPPHLTSILWEPKCVPPRLVSIFWRFVKFDQIVLTWSGGSKLAQRFC